MDQKLDILLGIHDPFLNRTYTRILGRRHTVTSTDCLRTFLERLSMNNAPFASSCPYAVVIMDVNLGEPASQNVEPGKRVYTYLQPLIAAHSVEFRAISGNYRTVEIAELQGIPCLTKPEGITEYLKKFYQ